MDYQAIAELEEYVLIHPKKVLIEHFQRKSPNLWLPATYQSPGIFSLNSVGFACAVAAIYENLDQLL